MTARATQPVVSTPFAPESGLDSLEFSDQLNDEIFNTTDFSQLASDDSYLTQCSSFDPNGLINYEENGWLSIIDLPVFLSDRTFQDTTPDSIDLLPDICVGESSGSVRHAAVPQSSVEAHEVFDHVLKGQRGKKRSDHPSISSCKPPAKRKRASKEDTGRRARKRQPVRLTDDQKYDLKNEPYKFYCTFCGEGLNDFFQWRRHEEAKHAPQTGWICKHLNCAEKLLEDSIFFRMDLFKQHFSRHKEHADPEFEVVQANPIPDDHPALWCGFCGDRLPDWDCRVKHVAAHFTEGMNLSQWWLRRAASCTLWRHPALRDLNYIRRVFSSAVSCVYCMRIFFSVVEAEELHPQCTTWSCAWFNGVQAAYKPKHYSVLWTCIYCSETVCDDSYTNRLNHLRDSHAYRDCNPWRFSDVKDFRIHLADQHQTRHLKGGPLEDACRTSRKSRFEGVVHDRILPEMIRPAPSQQDGLMSSIRCVDVIRRRHGEVDIFLEHAFFSPTLESSIMSRKFVEHWNLPVKRNTSSIPYLADMLQLVDFQVLGEVDLQWIGPLDNPTQLPQSRPVLYSTNFLVVEKLPYAQIVFGLDVQEDINKMAPHGPSGADLFDT